MKKIYFIICTLAFQIALGQIKGNEKIVTKVIELAKLERLDINLYGDIIIDTSNEEGLSIIGDSNLLPLIDTEVVGGRLELTQLDWIQPSTSLKIRIGAPSIKHISLGTNGTITIKNLNQDKLSITAFNGKVILEGRVTTLNANAENGIVEASELNSRTSFLNIWGHGEAILNTSNLVVQKVDKDASLTLVSQPLTIQGSIKRALRNKENNLGKVEYIRFKIKNNSSNRNNFYVIGPKPEGGKFSYGFPMMPGALRKENWTTGTKVYKVNGLGIKKLLVKITKDNEGKTVALF